MYKFFLLFLFFIMYLFSEGKFINPITDICWECIFPITVSGINVTPGQKDLSASDKIFCFCSGVPPKAGVPVTLWEPARLVDVTRHAYKLIGLGGIKIGKESIKNRGSIGLINSSEAKQSFYHVHWYKFPVLAFLNLLTDFPCLEKGETDVAYMSEFDLTWNEEEWTFLTNAEAALFSNPLAQLACIADGAAATMKKPIDKLFWCAGCHGSLYPFTGTVSHHIGGIQASSLLVHRIIAKLHRLGLLRAFPEGEFCESEYLPLIKKSSYKTQLVYPVAQTKPPCNVLGQSDLFWGSGKSFPIKGEDFVYLIWLKKHCCLDAIKQAEKILINYSK